VIELAAAADAGLIVELLGAQLAEHDIDTPRDAVARAVAGMIADPARGFILVARPNLGVAYVSHIWALEHGGLSAWLEELYVVPAERERGVGTALLVAAIARARAAGCAALDLEVTRDHARAERLYARTGFMPLGRARWVLPLR
jgi:GNAT superfamily N-acetyltransferase